jgi:uncharacterized protein (TIGR03083 family)
VPVTPVEEIPRIGRAEAMLLAEAEDARFVAFLRTLGPEDWRRPTDCDRWDVHAIAAHVLGTAKDYSALRRTIRSQVAGTRLARELRLPEPLDGVNERQVRMHAHLSPAELVEELELWASRLRQARRRFPRPLRRMPLSSMGLRFRLGQLIEVILTRDVWMHRVDIGRATGRPIELTAEHDGRLVADVVAEWAARHGRPFDLVLTGPAGGHFVSGDPSEREHHELDAVEFCRIASGRAAGAGLLEQKVVF